ncbi:PH domain-containing protein [Shinella yambaruensis]|uniref:YdbS-like PH domain-containing protein n=1 Tax=Shinella yambaruensis TaxID=415996 RepID=A0ABQ5ZQL7_9HYPH|nr:PH domain-containing protein [Shinella yambaruensis]MCJ8029983.1 PH domain-containing protein [Shinella yambaruensis]MCU7984219.1 PH domain-containing protein [Shinella yambaruensis]GLR55184.1 hypothetical protein GCM10007923_64060 [Shinella yambaruensis]
MEMFANTQARPAEEQVFGETRPSLWLAAPRLVSGFILAMVLSYYWPSILAALPINQVPVFWSWALIWILCTGPGAWQVLVLLTTQYEFTSQRIVTKHGVFNRSRDQLEIVRVRDLSTYEPFYLRMIGLGSLQLDTVDRSHPVLVIPGQHNVIKLKNFIHDLNIKERQRLGYREFENTQ